MKSIHNYGGLFKIKTSHTQDQHLSSVPLDSIKRQGFFLCKLQKKKEKKKKVFLETG